MVEYFKKPSVEAEAFRIIKIATWTFAFFAIILFLNDFANKQQNYLLYGVEFSFIFLLREFKRRIFSILLAIKYLIPIMFSIQIAIANNTFGLHSLPLIHLFLLFLCYRCFQASKIIHGEFQINPSLAKFSWIVYLLSVSIGYVYFSLITFLSNKAISLDYIDIPFSLFGLLGLFGYVFKLRILNAAFWKIYLFIIAIWHCYIYTQYPRPEMPQDANIYITIGSVVFVILLILPTYLALFLYGYKSLTLWNKTHNIALESDKKTGGQSAYPRNH